MDQLICASLSHTHYWYEVRYKGWAFERLLVERFQDCQPVLLSHDQSRTFNLKVQTAHLSGGVFCGNRVIK